MDTWTKNEDWVNWRSLFLGRLRFFIEENTDVKNLNKTNGGDLLHILQVPYDMIFLDLAPKWVIPVWKQPETFAINNCGAIYNYCKHVRGTSLVSSPFPIRYRTLLISEKKLIYVKERWQFFVVDKLSAENATKVARRKSAKLKTCHEIFWHLKTLSLIFFLFCYTQVALRMELYEYIL